MSFKLSMVAVLLLITSSGCVQKRLDNRLAGHYSQQASDLKALQEAHSNQNRQRLTWKEASQMLEQRNTSLQRGREQIANAKKKRKDQWLSLIPKVQGFVGLTQSFSELASLSSDDVDARILASFNIPNPIRFYSQFYSTALQSLQAEWTYQLRRRQLYVQLYTSFLEERLLSDRYEKILKKEKSLGRVAMEELSGEIASIAQDKRAIERTRSYHRLALNRLLNTPGRNWQPYGKTPNVSYAKRYNHLKLGEKFGKLALKLQTLQIESAALSVINVKLQRLPNWSQGLTSPVLFSNDDSSASGFNADNFYLFSGLSKTFDLTDITGKENLRLAKVRSKYVRDQLRLSMESEIQRLHIMKQTYAGLLVEQNNISRRTSQLRKSSDRGALDTILGEFKEYQELEKERLNLKAQIARIDIQFWLWDDVYWNKN